MTASDPKDFEFETTLRELEDIVEKLDREGVDLDEAIELFEGGIARLDAARQWLETASGRIEELITRSTGKLETVPLDDRESADDVEDDSQ